MFKLALVAILAVLLINAYQSSSAKTPVERAADSVQTTWTKASDVGRKVMQTVDQATDQKISNKKTHSVE